MGRTARLAAFDGGHVALTHYAPDEALAAHRHAGAQISLVLSGGYCEEGAAGSVAVGDGALSGKPAGFEHANRFGPAGALILSVNLRTASFLDTYVVGRPFSGLAPALLACASVEAAASALAAATRTGEPDMVQASDWLKRAHAGLSGAERLPSARAARAAGLHRATFTRRFRQTFGSPPAVVRQSARLAQVLGGILHSNRSLSELALEAGYADQAHMTRHVRRATGLPPARLRRLFASNT